MRNSLALTSALALLAAACSSDPQPAADAGTTPRDAAAIVHDDAATAPPDSGTAPADAGTEPGDAGFPDGAAVRAELDQRCDYRQRLGLLTVSNQGGGFRYISLGVNDKPLPWWGPPELVDGACIFHRAARNTGCSCQGTQVCSFAGACVDAPVPAPSATVTVIGANARHEIVGDGSSLGGEVMVPDDAFAMMIVAGDLRVAVPPMSAPPDLTAPMGTLSGDESMPTAVDLTWMAGASTASVSTHIRINHHVGEPTFTECVVPAQVGQMHIGRDMLEPLAVSTGLEFQGLEHVRYARANVAGGCFEIRFTTQAFVSLNR